MHDVCVKPTELSFAPAVSAIILVLTARKSRGPNDNMHQRMPTFVLSSAKHYGNGRIVGI